MHSKKKRKRKEQNGVVLNDTVHLLPPDHAAGKKEKGKLFFEFCRPLSRLEPTDRTQWPTTHRAPARKPRRGGRALAVAPNGRPAGCSPCSTAESHSLGSINSSQHSRREGRTEGEEKKTKNRGEREEEIERRREKEEKKHTKEKKQTEIEQRREKE